MMTVTHSAVSTALAVAATLGSGVFLAVTWRRRGEPTAPPLVGLAAVLFAGTGVHLLAALGPTRERLAGVFGSGIAEAWVPLANVCYVATLGLWTAFVFRYTGRGRRVTRLVGAAVGGLVLVHAGLLVAAATAALPVALVDGLVVGAMLLTLVFALVGIFLVVDESTRLGPLDLGEALFLSVAAGTLLAGAVLFLGSPRSPVYTGSVLLGSALFVFTIRRYSTFESLPVTSALGRDRVIDEMAEAVVVVGRDGSIRDVNPSAAGLFGLDAETTADWSTLVPSGHSCRELARTDQPVQVRLADSVLSVTASEIRDDCGRLLGYLVVCQEVTDRRERERRLALLNRFLVETVSDRMAAVAEDARALASGPGDGSRERGEAIWTTTTTLITLLGHVREIERGLASDDEQQTAVNAALDRVAESVTTERGRPAVRTSETPVRAAIEPPLLESLVELLVTAGTSVPPEKTTLAVGVEGQRVDVRVVPDGEGNGPPGQLERLAVELVALTVAATGGSVTVETAGDDTGSRPGELLAADAGAIGRAGGAFEKITISLAPAAETVGTKQDRGPSAEIGGETG